jgi:quinohemoprotein ethanol dehydrogenase
MKNHPYVGLIAVLLSVTLLFSNCKSDSTATAKSAWSYYGGDQSNQRYSKLNQINTTNAKDLSLAWEQSLNLDEAQECTPILAEGSLFVTTALGPKYVHAFDAKTGAVKWKVWSGQSGRILFQRQIIYRTFGWQTDVFRSSNR